MMWATEEAAEIHSEGSLFTHIFIGCFRHQEDAWPIDGRQTCYQCGMTRAYVLGAEKQGRWVRETETAPRQRKPFEEVA